MFKSLSKDLGLTFDASELDKLSKELIATKNDLEATAKVVEFFEQKLKDAGEVGAVSMVQLKQEIQDIKDFISQTEREIKELDKSIEAAAPGRMQAGLMQDRERLNKSVQEAKLNLEGLNQEYKTLQSETAKTAQSQKSLQTELRKVKEEMVRMEAEGNKNSQQYEELSQKATKYQKAIRDVNQEIKHSASDTAGLQNAIGLVNGLVGVYATAQGAAALFGEESEDLNNTLQKLGGALAVLNGLQATQAELANKQGLANKALTYVQRQYALATDASAKSTLRLRAAFNLLGIGLIVSALAAAVVYWKDIAKWMGIVSEESERNASITQRSNELYGEQIAQLTILNKQVKEGGLSFKQKNDAVKSFNETFGKTLGSVKDYIELENRLIANGDTYIKYLGLKAKAEAAYQLAIESQKTALEEQNKLISEVYSGMDKVSIKAEQWVNNSVFGKNLKTKVSQGDVSRLLGIPNEKDLSVFLNEFVPALQDNLKKIWNNIGDSDSFLDIFGDASLEAEKLASQYNIVGDVAEKTSKRASKSTKDWTKEIQNLINELVKLQEAYAIELIGNDRDRERALLQKQVADEAKAYKDQINALEVSLEKKRELIAEYDKLYNEQTGLAYINLKEQLEDIDREYEEKAREAHLSALAAINEVNNLTAENELQAIRTKWENIRKELRKQIQLTEDEGLKQKINDLLSLSTASEEKETNNAALNNALKRIEIEKQFTDSVVQIYLTQSKEVIGNEKLKNATLLQVQQTYFNNRLQAIKESLSDEKKAILDDFVNQLENSDGSLEVFGEIADQMKDAFGPEMAGMIIKIVEELSKLRKEAEALKGSGFSDWFKSTQSFALKLGETLGLEGEQLKFFGETVGTAIEQAWGALQMMMEANINEHRNRLMEIEGMIAQTQSELEKEKDLYEQGYANNYDIRKKELEDLKKQKAEEKREMEKAQRQQATINKASILSNLAVQVSEMVTASTKIMNGTSSVPFVGVALGIGLIASLFAALSAFKSQAQSYATFRTGLEQGALSLNGASHERGGMGLYDSASGRKVAEYEGGEKLYALNKGQQSKYGWLMDMMIDDAKGRTPLSHALMGKIPVTGKKTIQKVRQVNEITKSAHMKRAEASNESREMLNELRKFNSNFESEFKGFKNRDLDKTEYWETPNYFHVKKNGKETKYKKKPNE